MSNATSAYARELLRAALELLDDEESIAASAMISGAIAVLERRATPAFRQVVLAADLGGSGNWRQVARHTAFSRSCA